MNVSLDQIKRSLRRWFSPDAAHHLNPAEFRELARGILSTRLDEIDCEECFERLDRFTEMVSAGRSPTRAMPLVHNHLERCPDCKQEFLALMAALQANSASVQALA
jgi:hypothetical protein